MKNAILLLATTVLLFVGCTENQRARRYGGTVTEKLPVGQKLVNVTWKEDEMWILTRDMRPDEKAESYTFQEKSSFGLVEGTVKITETKP